MSFKPPLVAIIGRTNVGKSTLFNKLIEKRKAITSPFPGTTRDRNQGMVTWNGKKFFLQDSGGLDINLKGDLEKKIQHQAELAIKKADLVLLVIDGQQGVVKIDREIARKLRKIAKPKILVVNKIDNFKTRNQLEADFYQLGLGKPEIVSALSGSGTGNLLEEILKKLTHLPSLIKEPDARLAIVGKTNVGKSSFVNALLGEERIIVSTEPHTTRDPQDIEIQYNKKRIVLIDTAGLRRKKPEKGEKNTGWIEEISAKKSLDALKICDVALLMLDATSQITFQDKHIAHEILKANCAIVVVLNKWDLIQNKTEKTLKQYLLYAHSHFPFLLWAPYIFISATQKIRLKNTIDFALEMKKNWEREIEPQKLKEFIENFNSFLKNKIKKKTKLSTLKSIYQVGTRPPKFSVALDSRITLPSGLINTLSNALRVEFNLWGTPIIIKQKF